MSAGFDMSLSGIQFLFFYHTHTGIVVPNRLFKPLCIEINVDHNSRPLLYMSQVELIYFIYFLKIEHCLHHYLQQ